MEFYFSTLKNSRFKGLILFLIGLFTFFQTSTTTAQDKGYTPTEIISQVVSHEPLWKKLPTELRNISVYHILDHGVDLDIPSSLTINGKPISLIGKDAINGLNGQPYFLLHTMNIESSKALVRAYLVCQTASDEKTEFAEFSFINQNGQWILASTSL